MADAGQEPGFSRGPAAASSGLHAACVFPIWLRASVYGVMECFSGEVQTADPDLLRTLGIIGRQIGLFIERTEVEAALRENESRTRLIIDTALDAVITVDSAGLITEWNAQAEQMFGWSSHEAIGRDLTATIIPPALQEAHRQGFTRDGQTGSLPTVGRLVEWTARHRGGQEFPVEISIAPLDLGGTVIFSAFIRNIASRKEAERSLTSYAERLERTNRELDAALAQAQAATEAKSSFLATMSHEIRTPMNGIIGMTGLLLDTALTPEQREYGQTVRRCGDHLLMLINDILDFSKIEAGKLSLERIPFDPRLAIEESLEILAERASSKGLNLASLFHADVPRTLTGDPGRLRQIVINLVGNAIKFTEQGEVVIQVALEAQTKRDATIRITVSDSGIGMTEDVQQRLFQSFSQADASTTRKYGGTGLGLAICKRLVELMQGSIGVTSRPGQGSSFWFTVILDKPAEVPAAGAPSGTGLVGLRVLIVDDKVTNRSIMEQLTRRWGMYPVLIDGGASLRRILDSEAGTPAYDVVLLDVDMEADDAVELGKAIKCRPLWARVPVVLLTSVGRRGDAGTAREAGFSAYLTKPIREAQLYDGLIAVMKVPPGVVTAPSLVTRHTVAEAQAQADLRILVAEDDIINQKVAARLFERLGYRVDVVATGLEAVDALRRADYGVVFMDCQMPHMDGFQATMAIRTSEAGRRHTPIVAMTANTLQGDRERCLAAGMDDYLSKPMTRDAVTGVLERLLPRPTDGTLSNDTRAPAPTPSMDWLIFNELRELAGAEAPDFLATLVGHFLHDAPASLAGMERALEARDFVELVRLAHRLKGSAGHLGALRMTHCCDQIQAMAKEAQTAEACAHWVQELKSDFVQVQASLAKELGQI
jgi:PAS domain S-box-containing protein